MSTQKTTPSPSSASAAPASVSAALTEAQSILAAAEERARDLKNSAEKAYEEARQKGYAEGYENGKTEATNQALRLIQESALVGQRLSTEAARLAIAISSTVIGEHVKADPELVQKIAARALQQSVVGDTITIIANPEDKKVLTKAIESFRRLAGGASVAIEEDPATVRGGCIVRTEFGEVDASIPVLLESMARQLGVKNS